MNRLHMMNLQSPEMRSRMKTCLEMKTALPRRLWMSHIPNSAKKMVGKAAIRRLESSMARAIQ